MPIPTEISNSWSDYARNWEEQINEACRLALQLSDDRKAKEQRKKVVSYYFRTR